MKKLIGPIIFIAVAAAVGIWHWSGGAGLKSSSSRATDQITVTGLIGGEKMQFLQNPEVRRILLQRYGIELQGVKAGSIEMVTTLPSGNVDVLWPSNEIAVELYRKAGGRIMAQENIFNSPVVLYTYDLVAEALIQQQIVAKRSESYYIVDFLKLLRYIQEGKTWKDIGLDQLYGKIAIFSTDPTRSNSGNIFCGLLANMYNGGNVVTAQTVDQVLPRITEYFSLRGYMESSSGDIFKTFVTTGVGAKPIIVGYENQLIEFALENFKFIDYLRTRIRTLYPEPTIWSSHPLIARTPQGQRLIEALKDAELQKIAWEQHGFRSGLLGVQNDPKILKVTGIPAEINAVIPMPDAGVMEKMLNALGGAGL